MDGGRDRQRQKTRDRDRDRDRPREREREREKERDSDGPQEDHLSIERPWYWGSQYETGYWYETQGSKPSIFYKELFTKEPAVYATLFSIHHNHLPSYPSPRTTFLLVASVATCALERATTTSYPAPPLNSRWCLSPTFPLLTCTRTSQKGAHSTYVRPIDKANCRSGASSSGSPDCRGRDMLMELSVSEG